MLNDTPVGDKIHQVHEHHSKQSNVRKARLIHREATVIEIDTGILNQSILITKSTLVITAAHSD